MKVSGENVFSVPANSFAISASVEGYTWNYSVDGVSFTPYEEATPAGETAIVNFAAKGMCYKLVGNQSDLYIQY